MSLCFKIISKHISRTLKQNPSTLFTMLYEILTHLWRPIFTLWFIPSLSAHFYSKCAPSSLLYSYIHVFSIFYIAAHHKMLSTYFQTAHPPLSYGCLIRCHYLFRKIQTLNSKYCTKYCLNLNLKRFSVFYNQNQIFLISYANKTAK